MTADRFYTDAPITLLETLWRPMKSSKGLGNLACCKVYIGDCLVEELHMDEAAYAALSASGQIASCRVYLKGLGQQGLFIEALLGKNGTMISPHQTPVMVRGAKVWHPLMTAINSAVLSGAVAYTVSVPFGSPPLFFVPVMLVWGILSGVFTYRDNAKVLRWNLDFIQWPEGNVASFQARHALGAGPVHSS